MGSPNKAIIPVRFHLTPAGVLEGLDLECLETSGALFEEANKTNVHA